MYKNIFDKFELNFDIICDNLEQIIISLTIRSCIIGLTSDYISNLVFTQSIFFLGIYKNKKVNVDFFFKVEVTKQLSINIHFLFDINIYKRNKSRLNNIWQKILNFIALTNCLLPTELKLKKISESRHQPHTAVRLTKNGTPNEQNAH